jgi:hypothetical protein
MYSAVGSAWSASVWFTAFITLTAGFPHLQCRCPDGHIKPVCFGPSAPGPGCCDRPSHRPARRDLLAGPDPTRPDAAPRSCCHGHAPTPARSTPPPSGLDHRGCTRVLTPAPDFAAAPALKADHPEPVAVLPPADGAAPAPPPAADARPAWCVHTVSPPTDLVILLQHFLI